MTILGVILLIIGFVAAIPILWTIGIVVLVAGAILACSGWPATRSAAADTTTERGARHGAFDHTDGDHLRPLCPGRDGGLGTVPCAAANATSASSS